ncbi:MAG: hypothetical protein WCA35_11440 [Kovacikia sp.]
MSEPKRYAVNPESLQGCRLRVLFHFKELQREQNPFLRANIAEYLAEAASDLARLEAKEANKTAP